MACVEHVTEPDDERLADYAALTDARLRKRYEGRAGVFIAEGPNVVRQLFTSHYPTRSVLLTDQRLEFADEVPDGVPVYAAPRELVYEVVRFKLHQGVIAVGQRLPHPPADAVLDGARLVAVVEETNDPENLGALFRSARGLGVDGLLLAPRCSDPLYRRSVRVSMGHVLHVAWTWIDDLPEGLAPLRDRGFVTVALTPAGKVELAEVAAAHHARLAVLLGAEGAGLTDAATGAADVRARITMHGGVDSLNVSTAAAIAFHALAR